MILDAFRLDDRVAIVTGAGRGIGAEIARSFAEVGASIVCVARSQQQLDEIVESIEAVGGHGFALACDVTESSSAARVVEGAIERFGRLDVLINNAGGGGHVPTRHAADEHFQAAIALNFMAPVYLTRAAVVHMKSDGGSVVNISSGYARVANVGSIPYGGAKAALEQATRMMAMEYAPEVRINAIRVGACATENMKRNLLAVKPGIGAKLNAWTPLGRHGEPEDIARAALFLSSSASSYITGKILDVDGGVVVERSAMELIARADALARD